MSPKKKIIYIVSHVNKSLTFEWIAQGLKDHFDLTFVLLNSKDSVLENFLNTKGIQVLRFRYRSKADLPLVFFRLCWFLIKQRPAIVHTHLFDATLIGLAAAWITQIEARIYTRHNSTFHHLYFPRSVKYDRLSNYLSTHIISISQATDKVLLEMESVCLNKVIKIPHGFDLKGFAWVDEKRIQEVKERWGIPEKSPCIGVVARHIEWKGVQYIIPAFKRFIKLYPDAIIILANTSGPYNEVIVELLKDIPSDHVILIPFEEDIAALYKLFDLYIHTPIDPTCEAFGQTYVEALASGVPSVFSLSGIAAEFIVHERNALVVPFEDESSVYQALARLWEDVELRISLTENGRQDVALQFGVEQMLTSLRSLYDE